MQRAAACPRCNQTFTPKVREGGRLSHNPLVLKCGHTFCENCCNRMAKEGDQKIVCSLCQVVSILLPGETPAKNLSPNYYLIGFLVSNQNQLLKQELGRMTSGFTPMIRKNPQNRNKTGTVCFECQINTANCQCKKCDCFMCGLCFNKVHSSSNTLKQHQAVPIKQDDVTSFQESISPKCLLHESRPIEYFCEDDETAICSRCVIMGDHKGHSITSMEERNKLVMADMEPALNTAVKVLNLLKKTEDNITDALPNVKDETSSLIEDIKNHFCLLHGALQAREYQLIQDVFSQFAKGISPLEDMKMEVQEESSKLNAAIKEARNVLKNGDEVVVNAKAILDQLVRAEDIPCVFSVRNPEKNKGIKWEAENSLIENILTHGRVTGTGSQRFVLQTLSEVIIDTLLVMDDDSETGSTASVSDSSFTSAESDFTVGADSDSLTEDSSSLSRKGIRKKPVRELENISSQGRRLARHEQVTVTHISSPAKFNVQRLKDQKSIDLLSKAINNWCEVIATEKDRPVNIKKGDYVLGRFTADDQWYRCIVKGITTTTETDSEEACTKTRVEVLYFDYGNTEILTLDRLYSMQPRFMKNAEFMLECSLYDIVPADKSGIWSAEAVETFLKMTEDKPMLMTVVHDMGNVLHVDLHKPQEETDLDDRPASVRDCLVFLELAKFATSAGPRAIFVPSFKKREYMTAQPIGSGETFFGMVVNFNTPSSFYIQQAGDEQDYLCNLMADMQTIYSTTGNLYSVFCPQIGMVCAAQYSVDDFWYRAMVVGLPGGRQVDILYVDFGIKERISYLKIKKLLDAHLKLPPLAHHCELADVVPIDTEAIWSTEACTWWTEAVKLKKFLIKVTDLQDEKLSVVLCQVHPTDMTILGFSINYFLVENNFAKSTGKWSCANCPEMPPDLSTPYFRNFETKGAAKYEQAMKGEPAASEHFFPTRPISTSSGKQSHKDITTDLQAGGETSAVNVCYEFRDSYVPKPVTKETDNVVVVGPLTNDDDASPGGNMRITYLSNDKKTVHPSNVCNTNKSNVESNTSTNTKVHANDNISNSSNVAESEGKKGTDVEKMKSERGDSKQKETDDEGKNKTKTSEIQVEIVVAQYESPADFSVQIANSGLEELVRLMGRLQSQFQKSQPIFRAWTKNDFCVARFSDGLWYRSKILNILPDNFYKVFFVDYGFVQTVPSSDLRILDNNDRSLPCKALKCHLADVISAGSVSSDVNRWSQTASEYMKEAIANKILYIKQKANVVDGDVPSLPVDILIEEDITETALEPARKKIYSLVEDMKEKGLAIPLKRKENVKIVTSDADSPVTARDYKPHPVPQISPVVVIPTYVDWNGVIYAQLLDDEAVIEQLTDDLQVEYTDSQPQQVNWQVGQACVALFKTDKMWYRARVIKLFDNKVEVRYLDFGNSEILELSQLRLPTEKITEIPQMCLECVFHNLKSASEDGKWSTVVLEYIHSSTVNCNITLEIMKSESNCPLEVNIILENGTNFGQLLVRNGLAISSDVAETLNTQSIKIGRFLENKSPFKRACLPPEGVKFPVTVTHMELPDIIYFQHALQDLSGVCGEFLNYFKEIESDLHQLLTVAKNLHKSIPSAQTFTSLPAAGQMCCSKFSSDDCWYRGVVIDVDETTQCVFVLYIDYGNSEFVPLDRLRVLPPEFCTLSAQAVRCKLSDLRPPEGDKKWSPFSLKAILDTVGARPILACIKNSKSSTIEIDLYKPEVNFQTGVMKKAYQSVLDQGFVQLSAESRLFDDSVNEADCDVIIEDESCEKSVQG